MGAVNFKFLAVAAVVAGLGVPAVLMAANAPGGGRGGAAAPTVTGEDLASGAARGARTIAPNPNEAAPPTPNQNVNGMHVYLWSGLKSHGEGQHDYPQFLADWSKILTEHGAVVDGSYHMPSAADLAKVDTIVLFKGDAGYLTPEQKAVLDAYVKRGGGIIQIHDSLCGPDPAYMASILGGGKRHGETNFSAGNFGYNIVDSSSPLMQGITSAPFDDEAFHSITWAPSGVHPLATLAMPGGDHKGEVVPQIWTYEHTVAGGQPARAFVWMQGHSYATIMRPDMTNMLLRGIAWAGKHPVNELVDYKPAAAGGGRGAGGGAGGRGGAAAGGAGAGRGGGAAGAGRGGQ